MDIASLKLSIDVGDVEKAENSLEQLAQAGEKTESAAKQTAQAWEQASSSLNSARASVDGVAATLNTGSDAIRKQQQELDRLLGKIDPVTKKLNQLAELERGLASSRDAGLINQSVYEQYQAQIEKSFNSLAGLDIEQKKVAASTEVASSRIKDMVAASLAATSATDAFTSSAKTLSAASMETARAQTQAMQAGVAQQESQKNAAASAQLAAQAAEKQQQELAKLLGQIDPVVAALGRLDAQEEKLRDFKVAGALDAETFNEFKGKLDASRNALGGFGVDLTKTGISAGQTANALRQLPMQFSDIFISLQAGQSPLTVFLQQGAQIKDSFGGVGNALRETAGYARSLINPYTLAAAAAAALALAYKQGSEEADAFNKAIITTGNAAGTSVNQLSDIARAVDGVVGTQSKASEALAQLAATGKIAAEQFELLTTAAISYEEATGQAVTDSIEQYKRLAEDPVEAVKKLNDSLNFLTPAIYEQIVALEQQGKTAEAAAVAQEALANTQIARSKEITDQLGYLQKAWKGVADFAKEAWDEMIGIGRSKTPAEELADLQARLERVQRLNASGQRGRDQYGLGVTTDTVDDLKRQIEEKQKLVDLEKETAKEAGQNAAANKEGIKAVDDRIKAEEEAAKRKKEAEREFANLVRSNLTKEQRQAEEVAKIRATGAAAGRSQAEIDAQVQAAEARFAESASKRVAKAPAFRDDAATKLLASLREQEAALSLQLTTTDKLTKAEQDRAKFEQQITDLKAKDQLTAEQQSLLNNQDAIRAQLDKNVAIEREVTLRQKAADEAQKLAAFEGVLADNMQRARDSLDLALTGVGRGDKVQKQLQEQLKIQQDFASQQSKLQEQFNRGDISEDLYSKETEALSRALDERLQLQEQYYAKDAEARSNWLNGVTKSFEDYVDSAQDVSGQTEQLFGKALGGIEDEFVNLATTGKASFRDLADSILADIARIGVRSLISNAIIGAGFGGEGAKTQGIDFGSLLSSVGSFFGGGRASGGPVQSGKFYEVGEGNKPELFMAGGKQYLIPGNNGAVVPNSQMGGAAPVINIDMSGVRDRREAREASATAARTISRAVAGSGRYA